ncbi:trem-like transcript 4 protein [Hylobates moloch]|uniref:trem-like transcript 4 protein n=1 Tax=Hylobates moloch TaxID=81572 RepID=UPI002675AAC7|nr:trem-like transcript 4 protein [Hylobates moloch]
MSITSVEKIPCTRRSSFQPAPSHKDFPIPLDAALSECAQATPRSILPILPGNLINVAKPAGSLAASFWLVEPRGSMRGELRSGGGRALGVALAAAAAAPAAAGSWVKGAVPEELHKHSGQTLFLQRQYSPKRGPYQPKSWRQQASPNWCALLVTSSKPQTAVQKSRYTIWDKPNATVFKITTIQLKEDSGSHWCGIYNTSKNFITVLRDVSLVCLQSQPCLLCGPSPGSQRTQEIKCPHLPWLSWPQTPDLCVVWTPPGQGPDAVSPVCVPDLQVPQDSSDGGF